MRRLVLIRHAKSSWDHPMRDDHSRPLNKRGTTAALALGRWIAEQDWKIDTVYCSTATRTQQTWSGLSETLGETPKHDIAKLYHAAPETMFEVLQAAQGETVAMIAHNPGIAAFAAGLVWDAPEDERFNRYPTGSTTVITFDVDDWDEVKPRSGEAVAYVVPRDLTKAS